MSPDSRHRPQSSRVQHRCPGRARQYRAGRVFLAGDSARIINPLTGGLGGNTRVRPGRPHNLTWKLWQRCSTARLVPRYSIPITMNGTRSDCSLYAAAGLCPVRLPHGSRRRGAPLIDYRAVTMGYHRYRSSAVLGASEDISPLLPPKEL
jgi:putative polyketide hydroxylase